MKKKFMVGFLCMAFTVLLFDNLLAQDKTQPARRRTPRFSWKPNVEIGEAVKDFELPVLNGGTFKLSAQKGTIVVIELGACT